MKAEQMVPTVSTCKAMRDTGLFAHGSTRFMWFQKNTTDDSSFELRFEPMANPKYDIPAPTVGELLEWLRKLPQCKHKVIMVGADSDNADGSADWVATDDPGSWASNLTFHAANPAQALALLALAVIPNQFMDADDVKHAHDDTPDLDITCENCHERSRAGDWRTDREVPCDDCGSHDGGVSCPHCDEITMWSQLTARRD